MNSAEVLTRHVLGLEHDAIPASALAAARTFLLDTLAVGTAGANAPLADRIRSVARGWGETGPGPSAQVWGRGERVPAATAAWINGFQIHAQEYDCVHERAVVHPMATIGAALMAEAEARHVPGMDFLAALVGAVDVAAGIGVAVKSPIRFFRPANAGLIGATLGIARMRRMPLDRALDAAGYALAQAAGTMQAHVEGKPALPVQIAGAARAAIVACDLAEAGMAGPHDMLEGPFGYFPLFEQEWDLKPVLDSLGQAWRIAEVSHKPWPTGRAAQGGIGLALKLRAEIDPAEIASVRLIAPPIIKRLVGRPPARGMAANYARLCFAYSGAVAIRRGAVSLQDFLPGPMGDPDTLALAAKITVEEDGSTDPAAFAPQSMEIKMTGGHCLEARIEAVYGSPADPMTAVDQGAKQASCLGFAGIDPARARDLADAVMGMDTEDDAASVLAPLMDGYNGDERDDGRRPPHLLQ